MHLYFILETWKLKVRIKYVPWHHEAVQIFYFKNLVALWMCHMDMVSILFTQIRHQLTTHIAFPQVEAYLYYIKNKINLTLVYAASSLLYKLGQTLRSFVLMESTEALSPRYMLISAAINMEQISWPKSSKSLNVVFCSICWWVSGNAAIKSWSWCSHNIRHSPSTSQQCVTKNLRAVKEFLSSNWASWIEKFVLPMLRDVLPSNCCVWFKIVWLVFVDCFNVWIVLLQIANCVLRCKNDCKLAKWVNIHMHSSSVIELMNWNQYLISINWFTFLGMKILNIFIWGLVFEQLVTNLTQNKNKFRFRANKYSERFRMMLTTLSK